MNERSIRYLRIVSTIFYVILLIASFCFQAIVMELPVTIFLSFGVIVLFIIVLISNTVLKDYQYAISYSFVFALWCAITFINYFF